jgi:hypothetical protein
LLEQFTVINVKAKFITLLLASPCKTYLCYFKNKTIEINFGNDLIEIR